MNLPLAGPRLSPLQRRTIRIFGACLGLIAFVELTWLDLAKQSQPAAIVAIFAIIPAVLVATMIVAVARYLTRENDEFIRALVALSMLWSLGAIMVVDTILGIVLRGSPGMRIVPIINIDLFCLVTPVALRVQLWRSQSEVSQSEKSK